MERWDILDKNRNRTGKTVERGASMTQEEYHLVAQIWIVNSKNEFLISKRSPDKDMFPNLWECTGGSAVSGDDSLKTALKETKEELGIDLLPENGELFLSYRSKFLYGAASFTAPSFTDVWVFKQDMDINSVVYQQGETCDAMWASKEKILEMIDSGEFIGRDLFFYIDKLFREYVI